MSTNDLILSTFSGTEARSATIGNIDQSPDDAARAIELSEVTGAPAPVIAADLPTFEKNHKAHLASTIVQSNSNISDYILRNSMASRVSNDDYGNLDAVSQTVQRGWKSGRGFFSPDPSVTHSVIDAGIKKFKEGFGDQAFGSWVLGQGMDPANPLHRAGLAAWATLGTAPEFVLRVLGGGIESAKAVASTTVEEFAKQFGADPADARRMGREAGGMVQMFTDQPMHMRMAPAPEAIMKARETLLAAKPWIDKGVEPPMGVHPIIDQIKIAQSEADLKLLEQAQKEAQSSTTKERAPALFSDFIQSHTDAKIGVSPDAIRKLYGDKPPVVDDNILGFIPDLANKLRIAEASGQDIQVSLADWLTKVDPQVAKELGDDVRVRPGGVTKNEGKEASELKADQPEQPIVISELDSIRTLAGIKTLYDTGERKLTLQKQEVLRGSSDFGPERGFHDYLLVDENNRPRISLNISIHEGGKQIYVEDIRALGKSFHPTDFGPSLMRSVLQQLREAFPNAEELTGFRVSGAREKAGTWNSHGKTRIKLDEDLDQQLHQLSDGGKWVDFGDIEGLVRPKEEYLRHERKFAQAVTDEVYRIVGDKVDIHIVDSLEKKSGGAVSGVYVSREGARSLIAIALDSRDPLSTGRHEGMHHIKELFEAPEWKILEDAVGTEGWRQKYKIDEVYKDLDEAGKLEEAIAKGYGDWRRDPNAKVDPKVQTVFEKIKDLLDGIYNKIKEILGREPTWQELFEAADRGDIQARGEATPRLGLRESREPELPGLTRMEDREAFARASAIGMTVEEYKLNMKLIEQLHTEDLAKAEKRAEVEVKRRQTETWKANEVEVRKEAVENINARPDIMADSYFRDGMFDGKLLPKGMSKLDEATLTPEQRAALPKQYMSKDGIAPDELAGFFGYHTGNAMVDGLIRFEEAHKASGKRPGEFKRLLVNVETQRLMEQRYGKLAENILDEAKEQALSETQMNLTHQDTLRVATKAGLEFAIDGEAFRRQIREDFREKNVTEVSSDAALSAAGRAMQLSRRAALKEDWQETFRQQQRHYISLIEAAEARLLEMEKVDFEKTAKQYQPREVSKGKSQEYTNYIQQLLQKAGAPVRFLPDEIQRSIDFAGTGTLESFVNSRKGMGDDPAVAPWILEGQVGQRTLDHMTVREFEDFKAAIDSLDYLSKKERKIDIDGEKADYDEWRDNAVATIKQLPLRDKDSQNNLVYQFDASFRRPEMMLKDLDLHQELGPLFKAVVVPLMKSKAKAFDLITDLAKHFNITRAEFDGKWRKSLDDEIPQDFLYDPYSADWEAGDRGAPMNLKRENLIQAMLNWGTQSGREKTAGGFAMAYLQRRPKREEIGQFEQAIKALIDQHATRQDWAYVERMQEPFKKWQPMSDTVARNVSGQIPKWIPAEDIQTPHGVITGGYWPMKYDQLSTMTGRPLENKMTDEGVFGRDYYRAATAKGYLKERTGHIDFVDIETSLNQAAGTMQQVIHDIAYRDGLVQAGKVIYDPKIKDAIIKHYGKEYYEQFVPWLQRIARTYDVPEVEMKAVNRILKVARTNLVAHALPFNINVIGTPDVGTIGVGLKVLGQTAGRIAQYPLPDSWANFRANRAENVKLAMEKSDEIRHLVYNMDRDYREALERIMAQDKMGELRAKVIEWGFYPVKMASQEFRMMTFVDKYRKAISEGKTEEQAAQIADGFVRLHHGAASVVDLPSAMQGHEAWKALTVFGGFFNSQYNFVRNVPGHVKRGEWKEIATTLGSTIVLATIVNMLFFGRPKKDEGYLSWVGRNLASVPMSWLPMVREVGAQFIEGLPQRTPLESIITASKAELNDLKKMWQNKRVEKPIQHAANVIGLYKGVPLLQAGRTGQGIYDSSRGYQKPKTIGEYWRLYMYGEMKQKR